MSRKNHFLAARDEWDQETMFGPNVNFAVCEAYKLLRTNVMYSFAAENRCHTVGVMSSVCGEGKSTTACNLAYALSEAGKRTLLLEGDLRLPSVSKKLGLEKQLGLTDLLVTDERMENVLQRCKAAPKMDIITAGSPTPNPSELLGSDVMKDLMHRLNAQYDYIIVDLPPVTAVTDSLVIAELLDGVIMVVCNNYVRRKNLAEAMRQLKLVGVRILGFAYRNSNRSEHGTAYRRYGKYYDRRDAET